MKILITGSEGYIGTHLKNELNKEYEVVGIDLSLGTDLLVPGAFDNLINIHKPDAVVHLAAKYGRVWGEIDIANTVRANTEMTAVIADSCGKNGIKLLYVSSSEIYGPGDGIRYADDDYSKLNPINLYGWSKLWGEQVCKMYVSDQDLIIARLNMPYGPGQRVGPVGWNALHTFLWLAHHGEPIVVHEGTFRSYTWVEDTARGLKILLDQRTSGIYNVARNDDHRSSEEIARMACEIAGKTDIIVKPLPPGITRIKRLDDSKIRSLGWIPTVDLDEGMARTFHYVSKYDAMGNEIR